MQESAQFEESRRRHRRKVLVASSIGATAEWYDFFLYGTAAALVFDEVFFPNQDPFVASAASLASFGIAYVARPLGGVVFGHFGDRLGRKRMLVLTLLIIGLGTFCIGILPSYDAIGIWAPLLLFLLRFMQGIGLGGEWGGAVLTVIENAPDGKRGLFGSLVQIGTPLGLLLGTVVFELMSRMPEDQFMAWGWRVPFLLSLGLLVVGYVIRVKIAETPVFSAVRDSDSIVRVPLVEALRRFPKNAALAMGARLSEGQTFNIFAVIVIVYGTAQLDLPKSLLLDGVLLGAAVECLTLPLFGRLSDRVGRRPVFIFGTVFCAVYIFPFFAMLEAPWEGAVLLAPVLGLGVGHSAMWAAQAAFFSEVFSAEVRYSGTSFVYQFSGIAASGIVPLACSALIAWAGGDGTYVALFVIVYSMISLISLVIAPETFKTSLFDGSVRDAARAGQSGAVQGTVTAADETR